MSRLRKTSPGGLAESRQDAAPTKIKGVEGCPQEMGFLLANALKTAFIEMTS
jgi:hypothetical protein